SYQHQQLGVFLAVKLGADTAEKQVGRNILPPSQPGSNQSANVCSGRLTHGEESSGPAVVSVGVAHHETALQSKDPLHVEVISTDDQRWILPPQPSSQFAHARRA